MLSKTRIFENIKNVRQQIKKAVVSSNFAAVRSEVPIDREVQIMAVTKMFPIEAMEIALEAGITLFGENRIQEALDKYPVLQDRKTYKLHFIGHLQRNKAKKAMEHFDMIQTVDSFRLAKELNTLAEEQGKKYPVLIQFNVANEPNKTGFLLREIDELEQRFSDFSSLDVQGLMVIPPYYKDQEQVRPYFQTIRELYKYFQEQPVFMNKLHYISMGMSNDYYQAIREGANIVRLGSALFGPRSR